MYDGLLHGRRWGGKSQEYIVSLPWISGYILSTKVGNRGREGPWQKANEFSLDMKNLPYLNKSWMDGYEQ